MPLGTLVPYDATGVTRLDLRVSNTVGGGFNAGLSVLDGDGREIADVYTLVVSGVSGATGTVTVSTASGRGPYNGLVIPSVAFNGTTYHTIVPGVSLPTNSTTPANGWTTVVSVGVWAGLLTAGNPTGTILSWASGVNNPGTSTGSPGDAGFVAKFVIKNVGAEAVVNALAIFRPRAKLVTITSPRALSYIQVITNTPTERVDGSNQIQPIRLTFANLDTVANPDEIDVLKDEVSGSPSTFNVTRVDDGELLASTQLLMDGTTQYQVSDGASHINELIFVLATTATNSSVENILVVNKRHSWIAPDVSGAPGVWTQNSVVLTQAGQPSGTIQAAGSALLWFRFLIGALAPTKQNPFPGDIQTEYALTGEMNWTGA